MEHILPNENIYKYRSFYWGFQIISDNELYFEDPREFPDTNDCSINIVDFSATKQDIRTRIEAGGENKREIEENIAHYLENKSKFLEIYRNEYSRKLDRIRVSCFSSNPSVPQLWNKYADCLKGMCINFNSRFDIDPIYPYAVKYCDPLPTYNFFKEHEDIVIKTISTKSKSKYSYEEEVRLFHFGRIKKIRFDSRLIKSIILGEHVVDEDIYKTRNLLKRADLQHVILKKASKTDEGVIRIDII